MKKTLSKKEKIPLYTKLPAIYIMLFIIILPLLAVPVTIALSGAEITVVPNSTGHYTDYTQYFREMLTFASAILLVLYHFGERIFPDKPLPSPIIMEKNSRLPLILCGTYLLLAVISSVLSAHRDISFRGIATECEGIAAVTGYAGLFLAAYTYIRGKAIKYLPYAVLCCAGIISFLFIAEQASRQQLTELFFGITDQRSGTALLFGNSVACGDFCVMLLPILINTGFHEKRINIKALYFITSGMVLCVILSTYSTTALIGSIIVFLLTAAAIIFNSKTLIHKRNITAALMIIPLFLMLLISPERSLFALSKQVTGSGGYSPEKSWGLTEIIMQQSVLTLKNSDSEITITLADENTALISENGTTVSISNESVTLENSSVPVTISLNGRLLQIDMGYEDTIEFECTGGTLMYIGLNGYLVPELSDNAFAELSHMYNAATGRGYIWLSSLPMLKSSAIIGCGAGGYAFQFPHNDIVGMLNTHGTTALLTDKPHSMYLGTAISYGIPALIVLLSLIALSLKRGAHYFKEPSPCKGVYIAIISYVIMAITNDSSTVYSPLFWIFSGILCAPCYDTVSNTK